MNHVCALGNMQINESWIIKKMTQNENQKLGIRLNFEMNQLTILFEQHIAFFPN